MRKEGILFSSLQQRFYRCKSSLLCSSLHLSLSFHTISFNSYVILSKQLTLLELFLFQCNLETLKSPVKCCLKSCLLKYAIGWGSEKTELPPHPQFLIQFLFFQPAFSFKHTTCLLDPVKDNVKMTNSLSSSVVHGCERQKKARDYVGERVRVECPGSKHYAVLSSI